MSKPVLLIVSFSEIANDARVLKQVRGLADDFNIVSCGFGEAPEGADEHIELDSAHPVWAYDRMKLVTRRFKSAYWGNPAIQSLRKKVAGRHFDLVLANDVDPVGVALSLKPAHGVHVDLHEYSPRQKEDLRRWRWFVAPFVGWMVTSFVTKADSWSTVSTGLANEYERVFGFAPTVVTNASPHHALSPGPTPEKIRLVHSGAALRDRKLESMIEGVRLSALPVSLDLFLTPNDSSYIRELKDLAKTVADVTVREPVPYADLIRTLNEGFDVGIFLLEPKNFSYEWALPNKLFDYVQARLGMVIGPSPEMVPLVEKYAMGSVTEDFSARALAKSIDDLKSAEVGRWKAASHAAANELTSEVEVDKWRQALNNLVAAGPKT